MMDKSSSILGRLSFLLEKKLTWGEAFIQLKKTKKLTTAMLEPLNISMDSFLALAQKDDKQTNAIITNLIGKLTKMEQMKSDFRRQFDANVRTNKQ